MVKLKPFVIALVLALMTASAAAQVGGREPLTPKEIDELRETAQEPEKRLKLMLDYARARLATIEQLRGDPRFAAGRGSQVHDLLEDFTRLIDELGDNTDDFASRKADLRKPLKLIIEADNEFGLKLRTLKEQGAGAGAKPGGEVGEYHFVLQNAIDAVNANLDDSRQLMDEQEAAFRAAKEKGKKK
ncbi:MAG: hypothetical protein ACR2IF_07540 [Terriglobales bacterium]